MKLSARQVQVPFELENSSEGVRRSCTHATLRALERLGLARLDWVPSPHAKGRNVELWRITNAGRAKLKLSGAPG
jgi:DNA-binding PadR family transcriptional regulator